MHFQQITPVRQIRLLFQQGFAPGRNLLQLTKQGVAFRQKFGLGKDAFHEPGLKGGLQKLLLTVLAGMRDQTRAQFTQALLRTQHVIDVETAATAFGQQFPP